MADLSVSEPQIDAQYWLNVPEARRVLTLVGVFIFAEIAILFEQIVFGLLTHAATMLLIFALIGLGTDHRAIEALVFVPLLRILNLGTGIISFDPLAWLFGVYILLLLGMVLIMRAHNVQLSTVGLSLPDSRRQWGVLIGGVVAGIGLGGVQWLFELEGLPVAPTIENAIMAALVLGLIVGFVEELLFRGLLQRWFSDLVPTWVAILLVSLLFGFMHSVWFNVGDIVFATVVSLFMGVLYARTENFWSIWGVHTMINVMVFSVLPYVVQ